MYIKATQQNQNQFFIPVFISVLLLRANHRWAHPCISSKSLSALFVYMLFSSTKQTRAYINDVLAIDHDTTLNVLE